MQSQRRLMFYYLMSFLGLNNLTPGLWTQQHCPIKTWMGCSTKTQYVRCPVSGQSSSPYKSSSSTFSASCRPGTMTSWAPWSGGMRDARSCLLVNEFKNDIHAAHGGGGVLSCTDNRNNVSVCPSQKPAHVRLFVMASAMLVEWHKTSHRPCYF